MRSPERVEFLIREMQACAPMAASLGVCLAIETSLDAPRTLRIIERIGSDAVQVYFDTGNTAGLNHDVVQEILELNRTIVQIHIKNSPASPVLKQGHIDFMPVLEALHQIQFEDYLVLEIPTSDDSTTRSNLDHLKRLAQAA